MGQGPLPAAVAVKSGSYAPMQLDANGNLKTTPGTGPQSGASTQVTNSSGNLAATAGAATLPAAAAKTTYITGFTVTGGGATAASFILITVTGVIGGTMTYVMAIPAGVTTGVTPLNIQFNAPVAASAVNTAIAVNVPSFGSGSTNAAVVATGYQQ